MGFFSEYFGREIFGRHFKIGLQRVPKNAWHRYPKWVQDSQPACSIAASNLEIWSGLQYNTRCSSTM